MHSNRQFQIISLIRNNIIISRFLTRSLLNTRKKDELKFLPHVDFFSLSAKRLVSQRVNDIPFLKDRASPITGLSILNRLSDSRRCKINKKVLSVSLREYFLSALILSFIDYRRAVLFYVCNELGIKLQALLQYYAMQEKKRKEKYITEATSCCYHAKVLISNFHKILFPAFNSVNLPSKEQSRTGLVLGTDRK